MYTPAQIATICNATLTGLTKIREIKSLLIDSREIAHGNEGMFLAIRGPRHDGHQYIEHAYEQGVRVFMADDETALTRLPDDLRQNSTFLLVKHTLTALQQLAAHHRSRFSIPVIGITGSNGKTIVKEWLYHLLKDHYHVYKSPKSYNSQVGVPLALWKISADHEIAIIEAGISKPGEMENLRDMIRPTSGIFTNLGPAHQGNFDSLEAKGREKLKLFREAKHLIYCNDHIRLKTLIRKEKPTTLQTITWGTHNDTDAYLRAEQTRMEHESTTIDTFSPDGPQNYTIPFTDKGSVENALHAITAALQMQCPSAAIRHALKSLTPVEMRMQFKKGINNSLIINDSYNLDIDALTIALEQLARQKRYRERILVLSDIPESGIREAELYQQIGDAIRKFGPDRILAIGPALLRNRERFPQNTRFFESTEAFLGSIDTDNFREACILLKGARAFRFELIDRILQQKSHQTVLETDLNALTENLNTYRAHLKPGTRIMAMVKAFSYGSGAVDVARLLEYHRVACLGVAYADEGVELRKAGIRLPIMVMNPEPASFHDIIYYGLEPEIYGFRLLKQFCEALEHDNQPAGIHLKVDTGMHRLGFNPDDADQLAHTLTNLPNLTVESTFSHLAASDDPGEETFTRQQIEQLNTFCQTLQDHGIDYGYRHILNTAGIVRYPEAQFDMVRLGLGLYGVDITGTMQEKLEPGVTFKTIISQIRDLEAGETIGYGRAGKVHRKTRVATIMAGYADGMKIGLGHGNGYVLINSQTAPTLGSICMDMCMVDVTDISAEEGDEAVIFGKEPDVQTVARNAGTIPYDILAGIAPRVKRIYLHG